MAEVTLESILFDRTLETLRELSDDPSAGEGYVGGAIEGFRGTPILPIYHWTENPPRIEAAVLYASRRVTALVASMGLDENGHVIAETGVSYHDRGIYRQPIEQQFQAAKENAELRKAAASAVLSDLANDLDVFVPYAA